MSDENYTFYLYRSRNLFYLFSFTASSAASKTPSDLHPPGPLEQSQSHRRLRDTSPRWKEHYEKISQQWSSG